VVDVLHVASPRGGRCQMSSDSRCALPPPLLSARKLSRRVCQAEEGEGVVEAVVHGVSAHAPSGMAKRAMVTKPLEKSGAGNAGAVRF